MKFGITVPIAGSVYREIEAETEEEAINIFFNEGYEEEDIVELQMLEKVVGGGVCYAPVWDVEIEELED